MAVDPDLVRRLERLAGLACEPEESAALERDLRRILGFVERLDVYIEGWADPCWEEDFVAPPREDEPRASLPRPDAVAGAPDVEDGCFLTP